MEEFASESRPSMGRRPTDHELTFRPPLARKPSDLLPPMAKGQFTPEVSPLDAFISRGRQLYRQLEEEDRERKKSQQREPTRSPKKQVHLEQPFKIHRSQSAGAENAVESLTAAVEDWSVGKPIDVNGQNRATKLFNGPGIKTQPPLSQMAPPVMPFNHLRPHSPLRNETFHHKPSAPQGMSIHEPTFRPVSQHPRISGFDFNDDDESSIISPRGTVPEKRAPSMTRSGFSSPMSPRMPFAADDDDDDDESFHRIEGVRHDLVRGKPQIFLPQGSDEPSPVSMKSEDRRVIEDQVSPRNINYDTEFRLPESQFPTRADSRSSSQYDASHGRESSMDSTATIRQTTRPQPPVTPPKSGSPTEFTHPGFLPKRNSSLQAPSLPQATTSTPNLGYNGHHSIMSQVSEDETQLVQPRGMSLDLPPPHPAFAANSAPNTPRPGSAMSDTASLYSMGGTKKHYNFSRPMSSATGEAPFFIRSNSELSNRGGNESPALPEEDDDLGYYPGLSDRRPAEPTLQPGRGSTGVALPSDTYTYTQYTLPRGREVSRESVMFFDGEKRRFVYDSARNPGIKRQDSNESQKSTNSLQPNPSAVRSSTESHDRPSFSSSRTKTPSPSRRQHTSTTSPEAKRPSTSSGAHRLTPQEHLDLGISLHEKGSNAESTYHFRLSAHGGNPSGMLMYGLALRHGWGMRQNPTEAVSWLRKAADIVQRDIAAAENPNSTTINNTAEPPDLVASKEMKSKLALAMYELGMSCSNGWGVAVDKPLALRYFQLAADWGDVDALSEAGFAYAHGHGCKKDLKRSAQYYRAAAAKGVSMVGNSWIWKDKYSTPDDDHKSRSDSTSKEKEHKDKDGNPRGLFGRKKSSW